ncbi:hypothetical protein CspeluHIS016_0211830 [Cutaneotrichosporon spelunceum]|uniref:Superoxide dismutase [Cu-Zn] n=1 Tax=Cutaneotrichosporon spelunceum TaxID=1672016 RepID=A0AAD3TTA7_9TREE|nr:hypothetical protein CspeluHIS016_0211830 [Cutaneotrichosporon spelunceum]
MQIPLAATFTCAAHLAAMVDITGPGAEGWVYLEQNGDKMTVTGEIRNLSPNTLHGFHIHEFGDLSDGCTSTGAHYNPFGHQHGAPSDTNRHVGDLGNVPTDSNGVARFKITDCVARLCGEHAVMGRAVVVHFGTDDLGRGGHDDSKETGHAGGRAGCGVIAYARVGLLD